MSETNVNAGFDFYLRFAKPLVLNLPEAKDRVLAAAWIQKLRSDTFGSDKLRTDYLKLLLFVLQKGRLLGPFVNNPNQYEALDEFPVATKLHEIAKYWLEAEEVQKRKRILQGLGSGDLPPFTTDCSGDLLEYVAAQDIPNFGVHAYYAISKEPIPRWDNVEMGVFPKGAFGSVQKAVSATTTATVPSETEQSERSRTRSRSRSRSRPKRSDEEIGGVHKLHPKSPLGSKRPDEERLPPTWGSNLISVGDPPVPEHLFRKEEAEPGLPSGLPSSIASSSIGRERAPPYRTPPRHELPEGDASLFFMESPPEFFDDSQLGSTISTPSPRKSPPRRGPVVSTPVYEPPSFIEEEMEAPSLPYRTPPWDMSAPSLPYETPPWDMSAPSLPYETPPWDMSAPSLPYATPHISAPSLPYRTPPLKPQRLFKSTPEPESDVSSGDFDDTFGSSGEYPSFPSLPPSPELRGTPEKKRDVLSIIEAQYQDLLDDRESRIPTRRYFLTPVKKSPRSEIMDIIESGVASASPEAQDIIDEVMEELSASQVAPDLEEVYAEIEQKYPGRRRDMPRTPPILSRYPKVREAGKRITYRPEEFEIPADVEWKGAPEYMESAPPLSPKVDLRETRRPRPFQELFPTVERMEEEERFFDVEEDDVLTQSPRITLQKRLREVMGEISRAAAEVPAVGGIPVTTPRRSPGPVRSPEIENEYPIFFEQAPEFESPTAMMSPKSRLADAMERQYEMLQSPEARAQPSPQKMRTPEFIRQMQLEEEAKRSPADEFGLPIVQKYTSPVPPAKKLPSPPKPAISPPKEAAPPPEKEEPQKGQTIEEILAKVNRQYEDLYASFVEEPGPSTEAPPISPTKRTPTREEAMVLGIPPVERLPSPPPWSPKLTPPEKPRLPPGKLKPKPFVPERYEDVIDFEFPPEELYEFHPGTPPSPPPRFAYESPEYSPREEMDLLSPPTEYEDVFDRSYPDEIDAYSPPMKDILAAHEFTEGFFDPRRPFMTRSIHVGTGTRKRIARRSAPPGLKDVYESPEREFPPSPEAFQYRTVDVSKMGRPPEVLPTLEDYGPLTQEEEYYISEFEDPKQQEMLRHVMRIVADVGEPLVSASDIRAQIRSELPSYSAEEDLLEDNYPEDFWYSPPAYTTPPRTPEETYEIPEFGFQQPQEEFVSPRVSPRRTPSPRPTTSRAVSPKPISPRPLAARPPSPRAPSPRVPSPRAPSPRTPPGVLDTSPPLELESPTYEPSIEEIRAMPWPDFPNRKRMYVRRGITGMVPVEYHEPPFFVRDMPVALLFNQEMDVIHEVAETEHDEEHPEFITKVKSALRLEPSLRRRREMRGARSRKPGLRTMSEIDEYPVEYPPSPVSARSPVSTPPRLAGPTPITYEGPSLVDVSTPRRASPRRTPSPRKAHRVKRKITARKLDFDTAPPSPEPQKTVPLSPPDEDVFVPGLSRKIRELERRHADLPPFPQPPLPQDLMGYEGVVDGGYPYTEMDYSPPRYLPPPLQPPPQIPGWKTPPHLITKKKTPPKPFKFELRSSLRDILFQEEEPEGFGSPAGLDWSSYEPLGTEWGGFLSPEATPYEFEPSPTREFGPQEGGVRVRTPPRRAIPSRARGVDPFAMSAAEYEALFQQPSPEKEPSEALLKARAVAQEQYAQLFDSPSEAPKLPSPPRKVVKTTTTTVRQRPPPEPVVEPPRRRTRRVDAGPRTPPHQDVFKRREYDFIVTQLPPLDFMPPGSPPTPTSYRTAMEDTRSMLKTYKYEEPPGKRAYLYGHGVKRPKPLGQRRPELEAIHEETVEPPDAYEYWPGVYQPPPYTRPPPVERRMVSPPREGAAVSPPRAVCPGRPEDPFDLPERYELRMEEFGIPPGYQFPTDLSPVKAPAPAKRRRRKKRRTVQTMISETELERIERLVTDVHAPDIAMPPFVPRAPIVYEEMPYSPPFAYAAARAGSPLASEEMPEEIAGYASPRTPPRIPSPGLDVLDVEEYGPDVGDVTPPEEYMYESPPASPVYRTPPPGPSEYPPYESPRTPVSPPESLGRRVREHEYTEHAGDERKAYMTKYMQIKSKRVPVSKLKAKRPRLPLIFESEEPSASPPPRTPPRVVEDTLVPISPPDAKERRILEALRAVRDKADAQYASLYASPEPMEEYIEQIEVFEEIPPDEYEMDIMDRPVRRQEAERLPSALTDRRLDFVSPPRPPMPSIPKRYVPDYGPPPGSRWEELEYTSPPKDYKTPPREFEEQFQDVSFEGTDILETSPVYIPRSPPTPPTPPTRYPSPPSPIDSPTWSREVEEHEYVPAQGIGHIRSGNRFVRLQRKTRAPDLEILEEVQEETSPSPSTSAYRPAQRVRSPRPEDFAASYIPERMPSPEYRSPPPTSPRRRVSPPGAPTARHVSSIDETPITPRRRRSPSPRRDVGVRESPSVITKTQEVVYGPEYAGSPIMERTTGHVITYGDPRRPPPRPRSPGPWGPIEFEYEIPEAFAGQMSPEILDVSDIPPETYAEEEIEDYTWAG